MSVMAQPLVSVIMPVYNSEKYLTAALECVVNQTLRDIEIICVDDGSTDASPDILCDFAARDDRLRIITQENKGAGVARNAGFAVARGKYLSFLDSDDLFEPDMLETVYNDAEKYSAEVVIFEAEFFSDRTGNILPSAPLVNVNEIPHMSVFSADDILAHFFSAMFFYVFTWNKLYLADYIFRYSFRFQEIPQGNDTYFTFCSLVLALRIRYVPQKLIRYRKEVDQQLSEANYYSVDNWPRLASCEAIYNFMREHSKFERMRQGFADWSIYWLIEGIHKLRLPDVSEFATMVTDYWIPKLGRQRENFTDNLDFLNYNEFVYPGYIRQFFLVPRIAAPIVYELPRNILPPTAVVVLYGAGHCGVDFFLQNAECAAFKIVAWTDTRAAELSAQGWPLILPKEAAKTAFDYVLIAALYKQSTDEIRAGLTELGVPPEKIIWAFDENNRGMAR